MQGTVQLVRKGICYSSDLRGLSTKLDGSLNKGLPNLTLLHFFRVGPSSTLKPKKKVNSLIGNPYVIYFLQFLTNLGFASGTLQEILHICDPKLMFEVTLLNKMKGALETIFLISP